MKRDIHPRCCRKTILVADHSLLYRECSHDVLHRAGYRVLTAEDATAMLHAAAECSEIDLLLADEHLIEPGSKELARHFRLHHPHTPMLVMIEPTKKAPKQAARRQLLLRHPKPGHPAELISMVAQLFAANEQPAGIARATARSTSQFAAATENSLSAEGG